MTGRKLKLEDRWKRRKPQQHRIVLARLLVPEAVAPVQFQLQLQPQPQPLSLLMINYASTNGCATGW